MTDFVKNPARAVRAFLPILCLVMIPAFALAQIAAPPSATPPTIAAPPIVTPPTPEVAKPGETSNPTEAAPREIAARPALRLRAQSTWDQGYASIRKSLELLNAEASRLGLLKDGHPLAHFIDSDDLGFTYEAFMPLVTPATPGVTLPHGIETAATPAGKVLSFPYEGAYDELDAAYEAITALLDEKGFVATGQFFEEYTNLPEKSDDPALKLNIFVFLR